MNNTWIINGKQQKLRKINLSAASSLPLFCTQIFLHTHFVVPRGLGELMCRLWCSLCGWWWMLTRQRWNNPPSYVITLHHVASFLGEYSINKYTKLVVQCNTGWHNERPVFCVAPLNLCKNFAADKQWLLWPRVVAAEWNVQLGHLSIQLVLALFSSSGVEVLNQHWRALLDREYWMQVWM